MQNSIAINQTNVNSQSSFVRSAAIHEKLAKLSTVQFRQLKIDQHKIIDQVIAQKGYKQSLEQTLRKLANNCNKTGETNVSHRYLAFELRCSVRTVVNHLNRLANDGVIYRFKNGWMKSNITTILALKPLKHHKSATFSHNLTPDLSFSEKERDQERIYTEKIEVNSHKESDSAWASPAEPPLDPICDEDVIPWRHDPIDQNPKSVDISPDIEWDEEIKKEKKEKGPIFRDYKCEEKQEDRELTDEEREKGSQHLALLRNMLKTKQETDPMRFWRHQ